MVRFLRMTERQAIDRVAKFWLAENDYLRELPQPARPERVIRVYITYRHPCAQLRAFWSSYRLVEPEPTCDP